MIVPGRGNSTKRIALIAPTYANVDFLRPVLTSVLLLRSRPDEMLIADHAPGPDAMQLVKRFQETLPCPMHHIRPRREGDPATRTIDRAIAATDCDYICVIDADALVHTAYVSDQ